MFLFPLFTVSSCIGTSQGHHIINEFTGEKIFLPSEIQNDDIAQFIATKCNVDIDAVVLSYSNETMLYQIKSKIKLVMFGLAIDEDDYEDDSRYYSPSIFILSKDQLLISGRAFAESIADSDIIDYVCEKMVEGFTNNAPTNNKLFNIPHSKCPADFEWIVYKTIEMYDHKPIFHLRIFGPGIVNMIPYELLSLEYLQNMALDSIVDHEDFINIHGSLSNYIPQLYEKLKNKDYANSRIFNFNIYSGIDWTIPDYTNDPRYVENKLNIDIWTLHPIVNDKV